MKPTTLNKYIFALYGILSGVFALVGDIVIFAFAPLIVTDKFQYKSKLAGALYLISWTYHLKETKIIIGGELCPKKHSKTSRI